MIHAWPALLCMSPPDWPDTGKRNQLQLQGLMMGNWWPLPPSWLLFVSFLKFIHLCPLCIYFLSVVSHIADILLLSQHQIWLIAAALWVPLFLYYNHFHFSFRQGIRSFLQSSPDVSPKFWRLVGCFKFRLLTANLKPRSIAFQRCIWRGGPHLVEISQNEDFLKKTG